MTTAVLKIDFELDNELFEDLLDAAGYGIGYWAKSASIESQNGQTIYRINEQDGEEFIIAKDDMEATICDIVSGNKSGDISKALKNDLALLCLGNDDIDLDASDADTLIQLACFKELRYA